MGAALTLYYCKLQIKFTVSNKVLVLVLVLKRYP
jgi:hypothetical protein